MQQLQPNTTLQGGKYRIDRMLGQGGFGITYKGYNREFEETVAIKEFFMKGVTERDETTSIVSVSNAENISQFEEQREKFKKEARRLRKLKNRHIVRVHDLFEENGTAYYVMDYVDGESLAERIRRTGKSLTENEAKNILSQILEALREVHRNEIWHLDIKPGNIMLDKGGTAYLIDFGASKQIRANGSMTTSTALCYTPGFAPNEQVGQMYDRFGPWTDIYALGATIYNVLTNKKPPMSIDIDEEEEDAFDFTYDVSDGTRKLILWMMQPKRKKRPQSVDEIEGRLGLPKNNNSVNNIQKPNIVASEETIIAGYPKNNYVVVHQQEDEEEHPLTMCGNAVDMGLSVKWADCNVGTDAGHPAGGLYGWGDAYGEKTSTDYRDYLDVVGGTYLRTPDNISGSEYDTATTLWGEPWRIPSRENWQELIDKCTWHKTRVAGHDGFLVVGPNGNKIFLPVTGLRYKDNITVKDSGFYWTSERDINDKSKAYYYYFKDDYDKEIITRNYIYSGRAIRPVCR